MASYAGLRGSGQYQQPQTERIADTLPRPQIVLALGLTLIFVNLFTDQYWANLWHAIIGPKQTAPSVPTTNPLGATSQRIGG